MKLLKSKITKTKTLTRDRKFGTDGIRGPVDSTMNPLFVTKLGWAAGSVMLEEGITEVLIGKDTRISGYMLESALQAGFISSGMNVTLLGPLPTPGVAFLAKEMHQAGVVISASHNLFEDNGLKFFDQVGHKFPLELEKRIEQKISQPISVVKSIKLGKANRMSDAQSRYRDFCKSAVSDINLEGLSLLLDCANGATYSVAPKVFEELGAKVKVIAAEPDGININQNCGSTNPENLVKKIKEGGYDLGIAFDGDGDRILIVSNFGRILDGDDLLYLLTKANIESGSELGRKGVVGTLMTNKALENILEELKVEFIRSDVGDKYVLDELLKRDWLLGGEPSGHIICLDSSPTGDAIIAALKILSALSPDGFDIERSLESFKKYSQTLINITVKNPDKIMTSDAFRKKVSGIEKKLGDTGRILIRPSGTEPLMRIMVESDSQELSSESARQLADMASSI